jgi:predicted SAM-dependent methyltransferase
MKEFTYEGINFIYNEETNELQVPNDLMDKLNNEPKFVSGLNRELRKLMPFENKLNIGSGYRPRIGWVNLDYDKDVFPDVVRDVGQGLPFDSDKFDEVYSSHVIEHVTDVFFFVSEIWRVCKNGARVEILAPNCNFLEWAIQPDHVRLINWGFFERWRPEHRSVQNELKQIKDARFNIKFQEAFNETKELRFILEVVK